MVDLLGASVFVVYMVTVLGIGIVAARRTEATPSDFYLADRKLGLVVLALTITATANSSFAVFGVGAAAAGGGLAVFSAVGLNTVLYALIFATIGVRLREVGSRLNIVTPSEYLKDRYESESLPVVYLVVSTMFLTGFVAAQLIGGGIALEIIIDIPYTWGVVFMALFMAVYIHISGMRGIVWSDAFQGVILITVLIGIFFTALFTAGSEQLVTGVQDVSPEVFEYTGPAGLWSPMYVVSFGMVFVFGLAAYPQIFQRYLSANSDRVLRHSAYLFAILSILIIMTGAALGVWSLTILENPANPDYIIPLMVEELTNPLIAAIALSAGVAALMSTADSIILSISSMISRDIYREHINSEASEEREVLVTQILLVILIVVGLVLALEQPAGIFALGELAIAGHAVAAPVMLLGPYWSKGTGIAGIVSMLVAGVMILLSFFETITIHQSLGVHYGFLGFVIALVLFIGISLISPSPSKMTIKEYV